MYVVYSAERAYYTSTSSSGDILHLIRARYYTRLRDVGIGVLGTANYSATNSVPSMVQDN